MGNPHYLVAPAGWDLDSANPFAEDGDYGPAWSCFQVLDQDGERFYHGTSPNGLFSLRVARGVERLEARLADFLRYEQAHGRTVIVACPPDIDSAALVAQALARTPAGPVLRASDLRWVVHSTPREAWASIQACGELRSLARLRAAGACSGGIGLREFGEPPDYAEYVVFGRMGFAAQEHVVASHARGEVFTDEDAEYEPGARLYFDAHRTIRDGLAVRDGVHWLKVRDRLPLRPYLRAAVDAAVLDPDGEVAAWTPRSFSERAEAHFAEVIRRDGPA